MLMMMPMTLLLCLMLPHIPPCPFCSIPYPPLVIDSHICHVYISYVIITLLRGCCEYIALTWLYHDAFALTFTFTPRWIVIRALWWAASVLCIPTLSLLHTHCCAHSTFVFCLGSCIFVGWCMTFVHWCYLFSCGALL